MKFNEVIKNRAKSNVKRIILPESNCKRILKAAKIVQDEGFADIILIGKKEEIQNIVNEENIYLDLNNLEIIDPETSELKDNLASKLHSIREHKGMTLEEAYNLILDHMYFGIMLLKTGYADGLVAGTIRSTAEVLRPALQIIKTKEDAKFVSSFFLMEFEDNEYIKDDVLLFADAGIMVNPNSEELAEIALESAKSFEKIVLKEPKVALLSYSTKGSAESDEIKKVIDAYNIAKDKNIHLKIDGELQVDAAIVPNIAKTKAPESILEGEANVLIFPDLNSGNISYKLVQRLANAKAYGPICQGFNYPINDLSRGAEIEDIVGVIAITAIQAQEN